MNSTLKKLIKRILIVSLALLILIKIIFELDNYNYKSNIKQMNPSNAITSPIKHKTLNINNFELHYYVSGQSNNPTILLLHPAFSDHRSFDQQIDFFSKKYRVITIDLIGHGLSKALKSKDQIDASAEHINEILKTEGITKVNLIGVSIGSLIAQHFALKHPDKVATMTALGGYNINEESEVVKNAQKSSNFGLILRALFSMKAFRKKTALTTCSTKAGQAMFYNSASHYERKSFKVMAGLQHIIKNRKETNHVYPTLIMTGEYDIELAVKMAKKWHSILTNSTFTIIEKAGHCANMDQPNEFNKIVYKFIEKNCKKLSISS